MQMQTFIANQIMLAKDNGGLEAGQNMYRAYFVRRAAKMLYGKWQAEVDLILSTTTNQAAGETYSDCIVAE
jgi:hypothetical protein